MANLNKKLLISLLLVVCLLVLAACGGKSSQDELPQPKLTEAQKETADDDPSGDGSSGVNPLEDVNEIPADGIITKAQFATVAGQDRQISFVGETDDGIKYTWTYHASQIQNPEDQNLKIDFDSEDLDEIRKQANNANDALKMTMHGKGLICPPTLTVEIPEAWQSDTGLLLKEQNAKLAKMSDVTIMSQPEEDSAEGDKDDSSAGQDPHDQTQDVKSLTEPVEGTTTFTMTVLSLDGDSYIVGGITDVDKLAAINQRAQAIASANANPNDGTGSADNSSSYGSTDSNTGTGQSSSGYTDNSSQQPSDIPADIPSDISNSGSTGSGSSGSNSGSGSSGDIANNDNSGGSSSGGSGSSGSGGGSSSSGGNSGGSSSASTTCTLSISCSTILNNMSNLTAGKAEFVPSDGWILKPTTVTFSQGESVHDVLQRVCREKGIHMESQYTPAYDSAYVEGINQLYEFDCGELSGWMYNVNGWFPNYGCSKYSVSNGDVINWVYTCDLGKDVGDNSMY